MALLLFTCLGAHAQEFRATLSGRVNDPGGAGVPGVRIEARLTATGVVAFTTSLDDGTYRIPFLDPGVYTLTLEKAGFQKSVRSGVQLQVAERAVLDIPLQLGEVTQSVNVTADIAVVQTESADRGLTIDNNRVLNTPLQGRNVFANAWSAPGVILAASVARIRPFDIAGSSAMAISGGQPNGNEVLVDGVSNLAGARQVAYVPQVEATSEFKVQTSSYDAQYGWTTGGIVNIITKSGGNQIHGTLYEFLQNTVLNANTFENNRAGIRRQSSNINTYGGDISGAIRKNKLFAAFAYEKIDQVIPDPFVTSVPTAAQKQGDFSNTFWSRDAAGVLQQQTIFDPFSTRGTTRDAFPGNRIPASRLSPIARNVLGLIPDGNLPGNPITGLGNLQSTGDTRKFTVFFPQYSSRVDYSVSERTRLFVRYSRNALAEERGFRYSTNSTLNTAETSGNTPFRRENHSAVIAVTKTLNESSVLDFRVGLARFLAESGNSISTGYDLGAAGFSPVFVGQATKFFPRFNWTNYEGAGSQPVLNSPIAQTNSVHTTYSKLTGRHNVRTGIDLRLQRVYNRVPGFSAGNFSFDPQFTGNDVNRVVPQTGNSIASFLLNTPQSGFIDVNAEPALQQRLVSLFVQDDIRVTSKLKVNVGLRWDYLGALTDRFDALTRGLDRTSPSPLRAPGIDLKGGMLFAGTGGQSRGIYDRDFRNFGPRAGFAYSWNGKTALRGGYGLIYGQTYDDPGSAPGFSQRTAMVSTITAGVPEDLLTNPFPTGILRPVGNRLGLATFLGQGFAVSDPTRQIPLTHQYSLEVQRELPGQMLLSVGYVGNNARRLQVNQSINEISRDSLALGAAALTASVPNPMAGLVRGTGLNGATVQRQQLLRPFPQFTGITLLNRSIGESRYDSLQALLSKRLSKGVNFSVAYTWSRTFEKRTFANAQDDFLQKLPAQWDIPHNLQLNGVYELPFGTGKRFAAGAPQGVRQLVSGWTISAIARIQQGWPMDFPGNAVPTGVSPKLDSPSLDRWFNTCTAVSPGVTRGCVGSEQPVWTVRQPFVLQTWSARVTWYRRPPIRNLDLSVIKNTKLTERVGLQFRTDFLNATNTPQFFNGPINDVNNGLFGRISGAQTQTNLPRFVQLSLRLQF